MLHHRGQATAASPPPRRPARPSSASHPLRRHHRVGRQVVDLGRVEQQEEGVEPLGAGLVLRVHAVEIGLVDARAVQLLDRASRARSRSSSRSPNWIDSVGQALAQAGAMSSFSRS